eukprot:4901343-Prymnesium_polylepis.1
MRHQYDRSLITDTTLVRCVPLGEGAAAQVPWGANALGRCAGAMRRVPPTLRCRRVLLPPLALTRAARGRRQADGGGAARQPVCGAARVVHGRWAAVHGGVRRWPEGVSRPAAVACAVRRRLRRPPARQASARARAHCAAGPPNGTCPCSALCM